MSIEPSIIQRLKNKDELALTQVYSMYSESLYGVIIRMCKNQSIANSVLQDTFLTIWEKADSFDDSKGKFFTWAYRIAKNKTLNELRKTNYLIQKEDMSVFKEREANHEVYEEDIVLKGRIRSLKDHHQKALELVYYNGLTHREAHIEMDVPLGTFKSYIKQALKHLKQLYATIIVVILYVIDTLS